MKGNMKLSLITVAVFSALSLPVWAQSYSSITVFGDSLSDSGNVGRFTVDGYRNELYDDHIADHYGLSLKPSSKGGNNFAQGNADAVPELNPGVDTQDQVNDYLKSTGGKADPHGLYIHWIGSNDVANSIATPATAGQVIANSAQASVQQVKQLLDAGAGTVLVPNVPHVGFTPFVAETVAGLVNPALVGPMYEALDAAKTTDLASREAAVKAAFQKAAATMQNLSPEQQAQLADSMFKSWQDASGAVNTLADAYNKLEDQGLSTLHGNIVRADVAGLFDEIIANPGAFNLTNTVGTACGTGTAANECSSDQPDFNKDENYLFADRFHPTPEVHQIIADYMKSILDAPQKVGALSSASTAMLGDAQSTLDGNLQQFRENGPQGDLSTFFGYAGQHDNFKDDRSNNGNANTTNFTFGVGYNVTDDWQIGFLYSNSNNREKPSGDFNYKLRGNLFGLYSQYRYLEHGWVNGDVHYADLDFDSINRSFNLGSLRRTEQGSANGKDIGFRIQTGWDLPITDYLSTSPVIGYSMDYTHVGGFSEEGNASTAMKFSSQETHTQTGSVGWRVDTKNLPVNPWAQVKYNHAWGDTDSRVRAGIKTTQTSFETPVPERDKNWVDVSVGANVPLGPVINAYASVSTIASNSEYSNVGWNVGLSATF